MSHVSLSFSLSRSPLLFLMVSKKDGGAQVMISPTSKCRNMIVLISSGRLDSETGVPP